MISFGLNISVIALFLILSIFMVHKVVQKPAIETDLLLPITPVKPTPPPVMRPKIRITPPTPDLLNRIAPKITFNQPKANQPAPQQVRMHNTNALALPPYRPNNVALPPQPKVGTFHTDIPTTVANNMGKTTTKVGGFGDPEGVHPNPNANRAATVAAYGSFTSAIGDNSGAGAARRGKVGGVNFGSGYAEGAPGGTGHGGKVATTGFNDGLASNAGTAPRGTAKTGAFRTETAAAPTRMVAVNTENTTMVQVISHPRPEYTQEAKQLKIQGDVILEVRFLADGRVHVIRVVRGLGHGLDEQAIRVAEATQFKPATRDGKAVDVTTYYRVDFQLA